MSQSRWLASAGAIETGGGVRIEVPLGDNRTPRAPSGDAHFHIRWSRVGIPDSPRLSFDLDVGVNTVSESDAQS